MGDFKEKLKRRKLIDSDEKKDISYLQLFGGVLIVLGIVLIIIAGFQSCADMIAIGFLITMLGVAFVFPSLLKGNDGLSTMRIVVFMMTNVICMLLLKMGWSNDSLTKIGLDEWWMGVIAFVFGAKATQSYFERTFGKAKEGEGKTAEAIMSESYDTANVKIIEKYIDKHGAELINSFPNVHGLAIKDKITGNKKVANDVLVFKVTKKINGLTYGEIPKSILYEDDETKKKYTIITDVEEEANATNCSIVITEQPYKMGGSISRKDVKATGTLGLLLNRIGEPIDDIYALSCYHVLCNNELGNKNKTFEDSDDAEIVYPGYDDGGYNAIGRVILGYMDINSDFAIAKIDKGNSFAKDIAVMERIPNGFGIVNSNQKGALVKMCGTTSGLTTGRILSHKVAITIYYNNYTLQNYFSNLIEVEKFSRKGDSGAAVLNTNDEVIGLLIADSESSSYVLPVENYLDENNFVLNN